MVSILRSHSRASRYAAIAALFFLTACSGSGGIGAVSCSMPAPPGAGSAPPRVPLAQLPSLDTDALLAHTKVLSSDEFEGRAPGTKGEELTVNYLVDQFKKFGLKPATPTAPTSRRCRSSASRRPGAARLQEGRANSRRSSGKTTSWRGRSTSPSPPASTDSELVFVGYGVVAPEFNWDDYKGVDVKGKTLVMLVNDPPVPDPANPDELDPKTFGGKAMTYYGRWTYKYEIAAEKGAAGVLIIHETGPAGYPLRRRAGQDRRAVRPRDARQEHGPRRRSKAGSRSTRRRSCCRSAGRTSTR